MSSRVIRQSIPGEPKLGIPLPKKPEYPKKTGKDAEGERPKKK